MTHSSLCTTQTCKSTIRTPPPSTVGMPSQHQLYRQSLPWTKWRYFKIDHQFIIFTFQCKILNVYCIYYKGTKHYNHVESKIHSCTSAGMHRCTHACTNASMHTQICTRTYTHTYTCIYMHIHIEYSETGLIELWPSDTIWWYRSRPTFAQAVACYLGPFY